MAPKDLFDEHSSSEEELSFVIEAAEHDQREMEDEQLVAEEFAKAGAGHVDEDIEDRWDPSVDYGVDREAQKQYIDQAINVLNNFKALRHPDYSRSYYINRLQQLMAEYFTYVPCLIELFLTLFGPDETLAFLEANERPRPLTIRMNSLKTKKRDLMSALFARGVNLEAIGEWCTAGIQVYESQVALGATPEYLLGHYMVQAAASFLPVVALAPKPDSRVLDMCAAPGGKTTHIAQMMRNSGVLYANDVSRKRLTPVVANCHRMGVRNVVITNYDGRKFPIGGLDSILLDAPCTGLGVIASDPSIKLQKDMKDVQRCATIQKQLGLHALSLLRVGGVLVYSTCSISVEENEAVVDYLLEKCGKSIVVEPIDGTSENGINVSFARPGIRSYKSKRMHQSVVHCRRVYPHTHNMDGFFVARIVKKSNIPAAALKGFTALASAKAVAAPKPVESAAPAIVETPKKKGKKVSKKQQRQDEDEATFVPAVSASALPGAPRAPEEKTESASVEEKPAATRRRRKHRHRSTKHE